jgi:hypothetical protein
MEVAEVARGGWPLTALRWAELERAAASRSAIQYVALRAPFEYKELDSPLAGSRLLAMLRRVWSVKPVNPS